MKKIALKIRMGKFNHIKAYKIILQTNRINKRRNKG